MNTFTRIHHAFWAQHHGIQDGQLGQYQPRRCVIAVVGSAWTPSPPPVPEDVNALKADAAQHQDAIEDLNQQLLASNLTLARLPATSSWLWTMVAAVFFCADVLDWGWALSLSNVPVLLAASVGLTLAAGSTLFGHVALQRGDAALESPVVALRRAGALAILLGGAFGMFLLRRDMASSGDDASIANLLSVLLACGVVLLPILSATTWSHRAAATLRDVYVRDHAVRVAELERRRAALAVAQAALCPPSGPSEEESFVTAVYEAAFRRAAAAKAKHFKEVSDEDDTVR